MVSLDKLEAEGNRVAIQAARHTASYAYRWNKQDEADKKAAANDRYPGITSSAELVKGFVPPDYHIDGVAQAGFFYSLTAMTGTGKTAVLLLIAALTALGEPLGDLEVKQGRVRYFAGENTDDVTMRWIAMSHHMGFDTGDIDVHFLKGDVLYPRDARTYPAGRGAPRRGEHDCCRYQRRLLPGDDENSNTELGNHARELRSLTTLGGHPSCSWLRIPSKTPTPTTSCREAVAPSLARWMVRSLGHSPHVPVTSFMSSVKSWKLGRRAPSRIGGS